MRVFFTLVTYLGDIDIYEKRKGLVTGGGG